ncbi:hypothetical protein [Cellvibrio sp. OA-2007]|uniref:hypothetical protein n=1 Tax=Cellvibrio sp. OA-2007 TaxID=529823 RepID=UPI000785B3C7|nr:hypothetical protein [Cellvibrio sp. OA-2007]
MKSVFAFSCIALFAVSSGESQAQDTDENDISKIIIEKYIEKEGPKQKCEKELERLPVSLCNEVIICVSQSITGNNCDKENLKITASKELKKPEFLNSALNKWIGNKTPFGFEFKSLESDKNNETVLGLTYNIDHSFFKGDEIKSTTDYVIEREGSFKASGTITEDSDSNPRNFLETKLTLSQSYSTRIPMQPTVFQDAITKMALVDAACDYETAVVTPDCQKAEENIYALLDSTSDFLTSFQYLKGGLEAGYETDQKFKAKQSTFGAYFYGQYEDWGTHSWAGLLKVTPSLRLAIDRIDPNDDTPRAQAGDNSSYYRFSGEISAWVPLGTFYDRIVVFTANYRLYSELDPSDIVKNADLDSYNLRTFSLSNPNGLFVSYSSGKLPFDLQSDDVIALGFKTYF